MSKLEQVDLKTRVQAVIEVMREHAYTSTQFVHDDKRYTLEMAKDGTFLSLITSDVLIAKYSLTGQLL